ALYEGEIGTVELLPCSGRRACKGGTAHMVDGLVSDLGPRVCSLRHLDHFRALDRVTRVAEIADADQPVTIPLEQDKIGRPRLRLVRVANQDRRPAVNLAGNQTPVVD